jgi:replicative DNA helicase Mcm
VPVHLYGEVAGEPNAGDRVRVNGIVETEPTIIRSGNQKSDRRLDWEVTGHAVESEETAFEDVEPERVEEIKELAERDDIAELFIRSFAPDILTGDRGDKHKLASVLAMFGGSSDGGRDDINLFFIGAPGTGKSQYLERIETLAPKAVIASGKGATAAGLTATATQSDLTGKWMLDAGALVLASGGVACIDEFDKMADSARQSMHEAMENQRVPINKAGINTTLTTKTTVVAAANPKHGSFDRFEALNEQVEIGSPLLSRFDLIFGVSDAVDRERDGMIADHQHERAAGDTEGEQPISDELMTEYLAYARQNVHPSYASEKPKNLLVNYYTEKRQESDDDDEAVTPVTPRMNDALRRLAQASARMNLREEITVEDAERAMSLMDMTLGDTAMEPDGTLNNAKAEGRNRTQADRKEAILSAVENDELTPAEIADETGIDLDMVKDEIQTLANKNRLLEPETGVYRQV